MRNLEGHVPGSYAIQFRLITILRPKIDIVSMLMLKIMV